MKKLIILVVVVMLSILVIFFEDSESMTEIEKRERNINKIVTGKVIEIVDNGCVKIEITKERGGYRKGDNIVLLYDDVSIESMYENQSVESVDEIIKEGDIISANLKDKNVSDKTDEYNVNEIVKIIY